ncbi:MAG: DNA polymerase Y family protein [Thermoanaerobaculia bacterium]|nr:DNA polymerase Y family protein [Thermoanaerobaculia bacterium]
MSRLACLWVPLFPLAARLRAEPELAGEALAVTAGNGAAAQIVAATRAARRLGVTAGMTLVQARALVPKLAARNRDNACERAAQEALAEIAERFSPRVEIAGPGILFLDADGLAGRFRPASPTAPDWTPERELGRALAAASRRAGLPARVGIAASKLAAQVAAQTAGSPGSDPTEPHIVATGSEAGFLAPLPLARLAPELGLGETLTRWGLASIGDFARLPAAEVVSRLGPAGAELHTVARGVDPRPLLPREPPLDLAEGSELEWPLVALEPFLFLAHAALDRISRRLEIRGLGCARLALELTLEPAGHDARAWELPAPTRDTKTLLTLVRLELEARPPGAAVAAFLFVATPDRTRPEQGTLFGPPALSPERLATTLARLFALLGPDRVGSPRPVDGHRPERLALVPFAPPAAPLVCRSFSRPSPAAPPPASGKGLLAVRTLRPPIALEVLVEPRSADHEPAPTHIQSLAGEANDKRPAIAGAVRIAAGPWRLEEGWWSATPVAREYWDVELDAAGLFRIYRDVATGDWAADGVYD